MFAVKKYFKKWINFAHKIKTVIFFISVSLYKIKGGGGGGVQMKKI